jgi:hypothetical protein
MRLQRLAAWCVHDEHRHVVVLLMAGEHIVKQVLQQSSESAEQTVPGCRGLPNLADGVNALDGKSSSTARRARERARR